MDNYTFYVLAISMYTDLEQRITNTSIVLLRWTIWLLAPCPHYLDTEVGNLYLGLYHIHAEHQFMWGHVSYFVSDRVTTVWV